MADPLTLRVSALACRRNARVLFQHLSFTLEAGQALALTGPNGVGKTSLLRILAGLLRAEAGEVSLAPAAEDRELARRSLFVSSRDPLKSALTVRELITGWQGMVFAGEGGHVDAALSRFGLHGLADVPSGYLSSGQRRRVSLARLGLSSLAMRPLWLLDEPTNALDRLARVSLSEVVAEHLADGGLVVAATHDPLDWPSLSTLDLSQYRSDPDRDPVRSREELAAGAGPA